MKALSVRQPWAWAILHSGKDVENRSASALRHMNFIGVHRLAIHASKCMTREEYKEAREFMAGIGVRCPLAADLPRGGVIGTVGVIGVVRRSASPWFFGPRAILLANPEPQEFEAGVGSLGLFDWSLTRLRGPSPEPPTAWMRKESREAVREIGDSLRSDAR